jgi:hypothetical protein
MTTTAAEGLPRRRFTVAELEQMTYARPGRLQWKEDSSANELLVPQSAPALAVVLGALELH